MPRDSAAPVGTITTELQVPYYPLASRCSICKLWQTHRGAFVQATEMLTLGEEQKKVAKWLNEQPGIRVTIKSLSRHYHNHLLPHFQEALALERRLRAEMRAMDPDTPATIASALARSAAMRLLTVVDKLDPDQLAAKADAKLLDSISRVAETIAKIDAYAADRRLKEELIKLRAVELALKQGRADVIARQWIISQLRDQPDKANKILAELDLAPQPKPMKALTAGGTSQPPKKQQPKKASKPNGSKQGSRAKKSSRRSRRPQR